MNENTSYIADERTTRAGFVCVHHVLPQDFYVITVNNDKSPVRGVVETCDGLKEAFGVARGLWNGIEIFSNLTK